MEVKKICILGGGTSGFIVSSVLSKWRKNSGLDFDIKVVHSSKLGKIGVGESTTLPINDLFRFLELEDIDWMTKCNATYKMSIRFEDFYKKGTYFHYPFGNIPNPSREFFTHWFVGKELYPEVFTQNKAATYFLPWTCLAENNKLTRSAPIEGYGLNQITAYHFDALLLADFLEDYSKNLGVEVIDDTFISATQDDSGYIQSLVCENQTIEADLFIDCSGFKSALLGGVMQEEYISFEDTLINNKCLRTKIPYTNKQDEIKNYTNCVALDNGWCWEIPLWENLSLGYVHSNKFASPKEIEKEFYEHCQRRFGRTPEEYDVIDFKTGRYKRGWVKNVIGIGLAYGFLEPLESTGLTTLLVNAFRALECLSKRDLTYTQIDRDLFNYVVGKEELDNLRGFVEQHYYLSSREDTEYWRYMVENNYEGNHEYDLFLNNTISNRSYHLDQDHQAGTPFIVAGMNYSCYSKAVVQSEENDVASFAEKFGKFVEDLDKFCEDLPSSYWFQKNTLYKPATPETGTQKTLSRFPKL